MGWTPLTHGAFSGIDWSRPGALDRVDPYLAWADADAFSAYRQPGEALPQRITLALELADGVDAKQLQQAAGVRNAWIPPLYRGALLPAGFRYCTALATPAFVRAIHHSGPLSALVRRAELGVAVGSPGQTTPTQTRPPPTQRHRRLRGTVAAFIDDGFAVAHQAFVNGAGRTRIAALWHQDGDATQGLEGSATQRPPQPGYGQVIEGTQIDALRRQHRRGGLVDEDAVYRALGLSTLHRPPRGREPAYRGLDLPASHGTQVMGLGAGHSDVSILAVQLAGAVVRDTSGGAMNARILDALAWLVASCDPSARLGINLSFGTLAGPHDGSSLLECAIDQLHALRPGLQVFVAAGNGYQSQTHAAAVLAPHGQPGDTHTLRWRLPPDDATPSFLEIWFPPEAHDVRVCVQPPGQSASAPVRAGEALALRDRGGGLQCTALQVTRPATASGSACVLVALAPTAPSPQGMRSPGTLAAQGVWQIHITHGGPRALPFDAWIERDDHLPGWPSGSGGAVPSRFEDDPQLPERHRYEPDARIDDPARATAIRRSGSFNSLATGNHTVAVGGVRGRWQRIDAATAPESPPLFDPDAGRTRRSGLQRAPDAVAVSDENPLQPGVTALGARSGGVTRLSGTSAAAPQVLRRWLAQG